MMLLEMTSARPVAKARLRRLMLLVAGGAAVASLGGCVSVNAPDKPIVIELNVNIKQEVVYRLADDVKNNVQAHPEVF